MIHHCLKSKTVWMPLVFLFAFSLLMLYVFAPVLPLHTVTLSPDYAKFFKPSWFVTWSENLLSGTDPWCPSMLLNFCGHPLWRHTIFFVITSLFAALGVRYYLKTQHLSPLAAWSAGLCFAFIGYSFTLFNAGHAGYFDFICCGLFAFGLMARCFQTGRFPYFLALGAVLIWAEIHQPDIWMLFTILLGAYAIWCSVKCRKADGDCRFFKTVWPRFLLTAAVIALAGTVPIRNAFTQSLAGRKEQMEAFSQAGAAKAQPSPEAKKQQDESNWIFATNWSMPPEDIAEFFVPGIWGDASFQPPTPYWGRLGQPFPFQAGRMMPNYRQHTLYLGVILLLMAFAGIAGWIGVRANRETPAAEEGEAAPDFSDVPFWTGAALLCTLLAMGRYTPFYRMAYALPFMNYLRAPVKFHHLTECAVTMLAGFGFEALFRQQWVRIRKQTLIAGVAGIALLAIGWILSLSLAPMTVAHIKSIGLPQYAEPLARYTQANLGRTIVLSLLALALLFAAGKVKAPRIPLLGAILALLCAIDLAVVARRYVAPINVAPHYARNAVVQTLLQKTGGHPAQIANYVSQGMQEQDWFGTSLFLHGFNNALPTADTPILQELHQALKNDPITYWRLNGVRFVMLPYKALSAFLQNRSVQPLVNFEFTGNGALRTVQQPGEKTLTCCEVTAFPPLPTLHTAWQGAVSVTNQLAALTGTERPGQPVTDAPVSATPSPGTPRAVRFDASRGQAGVWKTRGEIENPASSPALLIFAEKNAPELTARIDGQAVPIYTADAQWAAVLIPPGKHTVTLGKTLHPFLPILNAIAGILAAATLCVKRWREPGERVEG